MRVLGSKKRRKKVRRNSKIKNKRDSKTKQKIEKGKYFSFSFSIILISQCKILLLYSDKDLFSKKFSLFQIFTFSHYFFCINNNFITFKSATVLPLHLMTTSLTGTICQTQYPCILLLFLFRKSFHPP